MLFPTGYLPDTLVLEVFRIPSCTEASVRNAAPRPAVGIAAGRRARWARIGWRWQLGGYL